MTGTVRTVLGVGLVFVLGAAVLRAAGPRRWSCGVAVLLAGSYVTGAAVLSLTTTLLAVAGASVHLAASGACCGLLFLVALLVIRRRRLPYRASWRVNRPVDLVGLLTALASIPLLATASVQHMTENDKFSIWAWKGRALDSVGHVDPFLLARDPVFGFANRDYPLMLPSLQIWGNGWLGRPSERLAHVLATLLTVCAVVVVVALVAQLAGPAAAVVGLVTVAVLKGFLVQATYFVGDAPTAALALVAMIAVVVMTRPATDEADRHAAAVLATVAAAGAVTTKNEGSVFVLAILVAAALLGRHRRGLLAPATGALVAVLPWNVWARAHGLHSDFANSDNLTLTVLRRNRARIGHVSGRVAHYWPGLPWWALGLTVVLLVLAVLSCRDAALLIVPVGAAIALAGLVLVEVLATESGEAFYRYSLPRILFFPAAAFGLAGAVSAGRLLSARTATAAVGPELRDRDGPAAASVSRA